MNPLSFLSQTAYESRALGGVTAAGTGINPQVQPKASQPIDRSSELFQQSVQAFSQKHNTEPVSFEAKNKNYAGISFDPALQNQSASYFGKEDTRNTIAIA